MRTSVRLEPGNEVFIDNPPSAGKPLSERVADEPITKLSRKAVKAFKVLKVTSSSVTVDCDGLHDKISLDRVTKAARNSTRRLYSRRSEAPEQKEIRRNLTQRTKKQRITRAMRFRLLADLSGTRRMHHHPMTLKTMKTNNSTSSRRSSTFKTTTWEVTTKSGGTVSGRKTICGYRPTRYRNTSVLRIIDDWLKRLRRQSENSPLPLDEGVELRKGGSTDRGPTNFFKK